MRIVNVLSGLLVLVSISLAQENLSLDLKSRSVQMRRIVDFFMMDVGEMNKGARELKPRFVTLSVSSLNSVTGLINAGLIPVANFTQLNSEASAKTFVTDGKKLGVKYYELWSEPNRTYPTPWEDLWLEKDSVTWAEFCKLAGAMTRGARAADSNALICGPVATTDETLDPKWMTWVSQFLIYYYKNNLKLDYLTINVPYDPEQIYQMSNLAKSFEKPIGVKGMSIAEYPFRVDFVGRHIKFFTAFEECSNLLFAAKSHYRSGGTNTGLIVNNAKTPTYWTFYFYARMTGYRVEVPFSTDRKVLSLASYDDTTRTLRILVGNDRSGSTNVVLNLKNITGKATGNVCKFTKDTLVQVKPLQLDAVNGTMQIDCGAVPANDGYAITLKFEQAQVGPSTEIQNVKRMSIHERKQNHIEYSLLKNQTFQKSSEGFRIDGKKVITIKTPSVTLLRLKQ